VPKSCFAGAALAAAVRFFWDKSLRKDRKDVPQGLKPLKLSILFGTAEAVPFRQRVFPQPVKPIIFPSIYGTVESAFKPIRIIMKNSGRFHHLG
jgi:hypothetical protein